MNKYKHNIFFAPICTFAIIASFFSVVAYLSYPTNNNLEEVQNWRTSFFAGGLTLSLLPALVILVVSYFARAAKNKWSDKIDTTPILKKEKDTFEPINLMRLFFIGLGVVFFLFIGYFLLYSLVLIA